MKKMLLLLAAAAALLTPSFSADNAGENRFYEMRTYYAAPGKLDDLQARFRNHTLKIFEKHGMQNVGYWVPVENTNNTLIYILAYPSREARAASWKAFGADPEWKQVAKESEANGRLVLKAESVFLVPTDYSPKPEIKRASPERVFELRKYKAQPGKLGDLNARFRDHTVALFKKHGMENIAYWTPADEKDGASDTLIYILAHKSVEAGHDSFTAFAKDPDWIKARSASEANGKLTVKVESTYMKPADYSPMK